MRIYTRTGDQGDTAAAGGGRLGKDAALIWAYGALDETNSAIGAALAAGLPAALAEQLLAVQRQLFGVGFDLGPRAHGPRRTTPELDAQLEAWIDQWEEQLPPLTGFVLPGGAPGGAALHVARTVSRRAERHVVELARQQAVPPEVLSYLNRLSDYLFVAARAANAAAGRSEPLV